jgi:hypothetical protein
MVVFNAGDAPASGVLAQVFATTAGTSYSLSFDFGSNGGRTQSIAAALSGTGSATFLASQLFTAPDGSGTLAQYTL